jgi:hypothetical protein
MTRYKDNANAINDLNVIAEEIEDMKAAHISNTTVSANIEQIEDLLSDLDLDIEASGESNEIEEIVDDGDTEVSAMSDEAIEENVDLDDLEMAIERDGFNASQESEITSSANASETLKKAKANKPAAGEKKVREKKEATPRAPRDMNSLDPVNFVLEGDATTMSSDDLETNKVAVMGAVPTQKKIAEKYENLFLALSQGKQPSVYVTQAFKLLDEKKTVTSADIVGMFKGVYKQGTAQSQAGQILTLFDAVKIATRQRNTLVMNDNSVVADKLRTIFENAKAA